MDYLIFSVFSINNSFAKFKNCKLSDIIQPNFKYFIYAYEAELIIEDFLIENNEFNDNQFLQGSDCHIKLQNVSISKNQILNSSQFIFFEGSQNSKINVSFCQLFVVENVISSTLIVLANLYFVTLDGSIFEKNFLECFYYFSNVKIVTSYNTTYIQNVFYFDYIYGGALDITNSNFVILELFSILECFSNRIKSLGINAFQINILVLKSCIFKKNAALIPISNSLPIHDYQMSVILNFNFGKLVGLSYCFFVENYYINENSLNEDDFVSASCATISGLTVELKIFESNFENNLSSDNSLCLLLKILLIKVLKFFF